MVSASAPSGLGFSLNPFHYVKVAAQDVYHVASNPNVQRAAASAAQAYAPAQYAQASQYVDVARGLAPPGGAAPMPMPPPGAVVQNDDGSEGDVVHPNKIQKNKLLLPIAIGGGALVLLLLLRR